jgi:hypothetical protein
MQQGGFAMAINEIIGLSVTDYVVKRQVAADDMAETLLEQAHAATKHDHLREIAQVCFTTALSKDRFSAGIGYFFAGWIAARKTGIVWLMMDKNMASAIYCAEWADAKDYFQMAWSAQPAYAA